MKAARFYRVKEAAEILAISQQQVYRLFHQGKLPGVRLGGTVLINKAAVDKLSQLGDQAGEIKEEAAGGLATVKPAASGAALAGPVAGKGSAAFQFLPRES